VGGLGILGTFAVALAAALILGYIAKRLKISPIVGYLVAGVIVGPMTPGLVADREVAEQFAEIGIILLLFGIGLRFQLGELFAVWRIAVPGALIQSTISTGVLAVILHLLGWSWTSGIILGMAISVASTVVMALVLGEHRDLHGIVGHIAIGWTVVEDLLTIAMLLLLPIIFGEPEAAGQGVLLSLGVAVLRLAGMIVTIVVLGLWVIPWLLERVAKTHARELFTLTVLVLAVGIAGGSAELFGVSVALGAFVAGLAVGRSEFAARAAADAVPMRDAFAVLFFVSVGMLFDPRSIVEAPWVILAVLFVVVVAKPVAATLTVRLLGKPMRTAIRVGAAFSQVGEFSFILGTLALSLGLIEDAGWDALVAASIISIALNPTVYRWARRLHPSGGLLHAREGQESPEIDPNHCVLVGYGPVGQIVHALVTAQGGSVTVVDLNLDTVRRLKAQGVSAVYGDVVRAQILTEAGVPSAGSLVLSTDIEDAAEVVRQARYLNPELRILVRCAHVRDAAKLREAGAEFIAAGEAEVAVALAEHVSSSEEDEGLGSSYEERDAIRQKLCGLDGK
jgi:CPA2 family monovalent cation:H+ antiporter-2